VTPSHVSIPTSDITLIGTSHRLQVPGKPGSADLEREIERVLNARNFAAIAEEMSLEALMEKDAAESICKRVADRRRLRHEYCDPDRETRSRLGIPTDSNLIKALGQLQGWTEAEIDRKVREAFSQREQYWLERLLELDSWPVLFVCGADHVGTFPEKVKTIGRTVSVLHRDWEPAA